MKPGLLIVDMQEKYVQHIKNLEGFEEMLSAQQRTIDYFLRKDHLVGLVEADVAGRGVTIPQIRDMLPIQEGKNFFRTEKYWADLFKTSDKIQLVREKLKETNTTDLTIMGVYAGSCVLETIRGSYRHNIATTHTSPDILGDRPMKAVHYYAEEIKRYAIVHRDHDSLIRSIGQLASNKKN